MENSSSHSPLLYPPRKLGENLVKVAKQVSSNEEGTAQFLSLAVQDLEEFQPEEVEEGTSSSSQIDSE